MRRQGAQWGLLAAAAALSAALGGVIAWGRVRHVEVPQPTHWASVSVTVCADDQVEDRALRRAVEWWRDLGHAVTLGYGGRCDVTVDVDTALEEHGVRRASATTAGILVSAAVTVRSGADALTLAHELGHALGYEHPRAAPTGHMMHPSSPGWDGRGLEAPP